jgi:hypothetical protein
VPSSAPNMHTCCELESAPRSKRTYASPPHRAQLRLGSETSTHCQGAAGGGTASSRQPLLTKDEPRGMTANVVKRGKWIEASRKLARHVISRGPPLKQVDA